MSAHALQSRSAMSNFTVRRFILVASMLFCQVALADDASKEPTPPKASEDKPAAAKQAAEEPETTDPQPPWKLLAAIKPVSMEDVDKVVEANDKAVQACNRNSRRLDTLAVLMTLTIDGDGKVSAAEAAPQDQDGGKVPAEAACLARVAKKLKFPAAGTVSHVSYPFMIVSRVKRGPAL
jgi:hypothetical protein